MVLDSAESFGILPGTKSGDFDVTGRPHLLVFSANHPDSLRRVIDGCEEFLSSNAKCMKATAHTLGARRQHLKHRAFCVQDGIAPLESSPFIKADSIPQVVFTFTGQGAQWAGMGRELMQDFEIFKESIQTMDRVLASLSDPPSWTIKGTRLDCHLVNWIRSNMFVQKSSQNQKKVVVWAKQRSPNHFARRSRSHL